MIPKDLKTKLGYICKNKHGYIHDLKKLGDDSYINQFASVGFITKGLTMNSETWHKTRLADQYYKDLFGRLAYYKVLYL